MRHNMVQTTALLLVCFGLYSGCLCIDSPRISIISYICDMRHLPGCYSAEIDQICVLHFVWGGVVQPQPLYNT